MRWLVLLLVVTSVSAQTTPEGDDAPVWHFSLAVGYGEYGAIRHGEEDHAFICCQDGLTIMGVFMLRIWMLAGTCLKAATGHGI